MNHAILGEQTRLKAGDMKDYVKPTSMRQQFIELSERLNSERVMVEMECVPASVAQRVWDVVRKCEDIRLIPAPMGDSLLLIPMDSCIKSRRRYRMGEPEEISIPEAMRQTNIYHRPMRWVGNFWTTPSVLTPVVWWHANGYGNLDAPLA